MNLTLDQLKTTVSELPSSERAELAHFLLGSLEQDEADFRSEWLDVAAQQMAERGRAKRLASRPRRFFGACHE